MIEFLDSSVLVKRYVREKGSTTIRRLFARAEIAVARIAYAEVASALARACREGLFDQDVRDGLLDRLGDDMDAFQTIELRRSVTSRTRQLVVTHALRGYDAVQLASALAIHDRGPAVRFWSADLRLVAAAEIEGLRAVSPAS